MTTPFVLLLTHVLMPVLALRMLDGRLKLDADAAGADDEEAKPAAAPPAAEPPAAEPPAEDAPVVDAVELGARQQCAVQ